MSLSTSVLVGILLMQTKRATERREKEQLEMKEAIYYIYVLQEH
jgi:hypothetical protein